MYRSPGRRRNAVVSLWRGLVANDDAEMRGGGGPRGGPEVDHVFRIVLALVRPGWWRASTARQHERGDIAQQGDGERGRRARRQEVAAEIGEP